MVGPRLFVCGALLLLLSGGMTGCAAPRPVARTAAAKKPPSPPSTPPAEPAPAPAAAKNEDLNSSPANPPKNVDVVDPGGEKGPLTLVEAAKAGRERRAHSGEPIAVITDKSLPHLPKGRLTFVEPGKKKGAAANAAAAADAARDEQYWRSRALDIRTRWRKASDEVKELEESAAGWRRRFYAESDPYARDAQVKPEWDRVLDRLARTRLEIDVTKKELDDLQEEGRRAGALPGWLREGVEKEPADEKKSKEPGVLESKEPPVYKQDGLR